MKFLTLLTLLFAVNSLLRNIAEATAEPYPSGGHVNANNNNWAVLVSTSRNWHNYRHAAGVLSVYRAVRRLGIPDSRIILMLADDVACNPRNPAPATVFGDTLAGTNEYGDGGGDGPEVDYRGFEVTAETLLRVLTDRVPPGTPRSRRLLSDAGSNVLLFLAGHGGDGFMRLQDSGAGELGAGELADAVEQMRAARRYRELLLVVDTCQAATMYAELYSKDVVAVASALVGEVSFGQRTDPGVGASLLDRYTFHLLRFLEEEEEEVRKPGRSDSSSTLDDLFRVCTGPGQCSSTPSFRTDLFRRDPAAVQVSDFFGGVRRDAELTETFDDLGEPPVGGEKPPVAVRVVGDSGRRKGFGGGRLSYADQLPVSEIVGRKPGKKDAWRPPHDFVLGLWAVFQLVVFITVAQWCSQLVVLERVPCGSQLNDGKLVNQDVTL